MYNLEDRKPQVYITDKGQWNSCIVATLDDYDNNSDDYNNHPVV